MKNTEGFSLIELVVYIGIFVVTASLLTSILYTVSRIQNKENVESELNQELSFVMQSLQRLVKDSNSVEGTSGIILSSLTLRRDDAGVDPTVVTWDSDGVYVQQGLGSADNLTSNRVKIENLEFTKFDNPGGQTVVKVDLVLRRDLDNPNTNFTRSLSSSFGLLE